MLQKLLIAFFAAFLLSACSGSDSSSSETVNDPPPAPNPEDPDDPDEPEEPTGPTVLASMTFGAETSVDSWQARCADGGSCGADLAHSAEEGVLVVSPAWVTGNDNLEVYTAIDPEIADLAFANVEVDVRVTEEYLDDGNLQMQVFFENAAGGIAYTGWAAPQTEYEDEDGEMVSSNGWSQFKFEAIQMSSFSYASDAFALQNINAMGVQFVSNGKPADVGGDLWIDNIRITGPAGDDLPQFVDINMSEGWSTKGDYQTPDDDPAEPVYGDDTVSFTADKGNQQLVYRLDGPLNLHEVVVTYTLSLDEDYLANSGSIQPFGQVFDIVEGDDDAEVGGEWGCWNNTTDNIGNVAAGEEFELTCTMSDEMFNVDEGQYVLVGVQAGGAGTITVHEISIPLPEGPTDTNVIEAATDAGWYVNEDAAPMSFTDEGAQFNPTAGDQQFVYDIAGPVDLGGASVEMEFTVDADLIASGASLQPFAQQITGEGSLEHWGCWVDISALVEGENTATCVLPDEFELVDEESAVKIGIQTKNGGAGTIVVTDMTITLAEGITVPSDQYGEPAAPEDQLADNEQAVAVDADWQNDNSPATISYDDGVVITPDWTGQQVAFTVLEEPVDFTGATVTYVIDVPESYVTDGGMVIQPFSQQNDGSYSAISDGNIPGGWNPTGNLEAGENTIVHGPFDAPPENIQRVGVWLNVGEKADGVTGDIIIRSITIAFPE